MNYLLKFSYLMLICQIQLFDFIFFADWRWINSCSFWSKVIYIFFLYTHLLCFFFLYIANGRTEYKCDQSTNDCKNTWKYKSLFFFSAFPSLTLSSDLIGCFVGKMINTKSRVIYLNAIRKIKCNVKKIVKMILFIKFISKNLS
jgi:hypothetical protein